MMGKYRLEVIVGIVCVIFIGLFLFTSASTNRDFTGSDDLGSKKIAEISGVPSEKFVPIIGQWVPGGEIETLLFGLQAAIGGIILGLVLGYWLGLKGAEGKKADKYR